METSGWPKNQKRCWYRTGSPPPLGSKNVVLRFRSVRSMVIPAARTGREPINGIAVIISDQGKRGTRSMIIASVRIFQTVTTKLIEATIDDAPAKWREKIAISTAALLWATFLDRGG